MPKNPKKAKKDIKNFKTNGTAVKTPCIARSL
jgi:hypothetical protein